MTGEAATWVVVLVKDFGSAKTRLSGVLSPAERRAMARHNARLALTAARSVGPALAVCGSTDAAALARELTVDLVVEEAPSGQNAAGARGLAAVIERGATDALLLSSDLPLVTADALYRLLVRARNVGGPLVVAAAAVGREGTNALFLRPPHGFPLHFGERSLPHFAAEARRCGRRFLIHDDLRLALDIDEPSDLTTLTQLEAV